MPAFQHLLGGYAKPVENDRELVHQRDVEIALGIFDDFCRLRDFERGSPVDPRLDDPGVDRSDALPGRFVLTGADFDDRLQPVLLVAGLIRSGE